MKRRAVVATGAALIALQLGLVVGYRMLRRSPAPRPFAVEDLGGAAVPPLPVENSAGMPRAFAAGRPALVHFWATWCAPCRTELPTLLELGRAMRERHGLEIIAVSVDDDWPTLQQFFGGDVPAEIVRSTEPGSQRRWGTDALPDTYLVDASGRLRARYRGARDWRSANARKELERALVPASSP